MDKFDSEVDDLIENFDLKPITKGLGFHHSLKEEKEVKINLQKQSNSLKNEIEVRIQELNKTSTAPTGPKPVDMGELAPFYTNQENTAAEETVLSEKAELFTADSEDEMVLEAAMGQRIAAWLIDFVILFSTMLMIFAVIVYFADLPMDFISTFMISDDMGLSFISISAMFYIFYFSFFEKTNFSTPGKNILGLKVIGLKGRVSLVQSFVRSILGIVSLPLLGLPLFLKLHDRMTDTQVIQK